MTGAGEQFLGDERLIQDAVSRYAGLQEDGKHREHTDTSLVVIASLRALADHVSSTGVRCEDSDVRQFVQGISRAVHPNEI